MIDRKILDAIFDKVPMGIFIADSDGYYKYANPKACSMTGYKINELIGMHWMDLVPEDEKSGITERQKPLWKDDILETKEPYETKKGEIRYWGVKVMNLSNGMIASLTEDITDYENLVAENKMNLKRLMLAGEIGKVGSWEYDVASDKLWRSAEAARQFTGISEEDIISIEEIKENVTQSSMLQKAIDRMIETGHDMDFEFEISPSDTENKRYLKTYGRVLRDENEITKVIATTVDVTELKETQAQITAEKNRLQGYLDIAGVIIIALDNAGRVMLINQKGCEILGYDEEYIIGKNWVENFIPRYLREKIKDIHSSNVFDVSDSCVEFENPVIDSKGNEKIILWKNTTIKDSDGIIIGSLSSGEDVTEKRRIEKKLAKSEVSLKKAEILTKSGHFERDLSTGEMHWSDGMYMLLGHEPQSFRITDEEYSNMLPPDSAGRLEKEYHKALRGSGEFEVEIEAVKKDNGTILLQIVGAVEYEGKKPVKLLATCRDITGSREYLEHIEYISYHDQLTGLYNRRFLEEEFNRLDVQRNYPLAVIMADVNGLKLANDTFGHAEGDKMLKNTADVLRMSVRKDDIISRIGGDEFMILLPRIEHDKVEGIIGRIIEDSKDFQSTTLPLSIAVGYAVKEESGVSRDELFKISEDNMYRNKLHDVSSRRSEAIKIISDALYEKNKREEAHSERVSKICTMIGAAAGLPRVELNELKTLGLMHDIGKIAVEEEFLNKPSALTAEEFDNIKKHPEAGFRILSTSNDLAELAEYVLAHHERWDGRGYPRGIAGEEIPFQSRIIAIAEAYDAMTSKSPYNRPMAPRKAYLEIRKNAGTQFDPVLARLFLQEVWPDLL